ncbi:class I SAM-dependent methyltransferase [Sphaerisporangium sp. TRM90804]|uniref:class I SAM-dependent methyltransferase n=1 Tax=Sphaerisporangium sp. TRM90804 TaxID=3031113 RepID=UPI0024483711|nr:class I SAM-dependent methyltransferase [Sphaerisporangium sp. TRM90804]MDH2427907.1 class I SAM-dependent methyltransferase [Sphaerisporangium sp. TRM90804]
MPDPSPAAPFRADLARSVRLFRAFTAEQSDQDRYYSLLAADTAAQLEQHVRLAGRTVLDVGGGPGYFARAFEARGARCLRLDADAGELAGTGAPADGGVLGSALDLPVRDASVDVCFSSNVLEHVPDPWRMCAEMVRVTRPGGVVYLAYTNWLSPWGGHETSPWHYLGGHRAARRYERVHGRPPKNRYGHSLYPVSVGAALRWVARREDVEPLAVAPRYLPAWAGPVVRLPGVREIVTWNLLLVLRRR